MPFKKSDLPCSFTHAKKQPGPPVGVPVVMGECLNAVRSDEFLVAVLASLVEFLLDADELVVLGHAVGV